MKILITGGAGFIGSHLTKAYLEAGHQVLIVDDLSAEHSAPDWDEVELRPISVLDRAGLRQAFEDFQPRAVSHHAGLVSVRRSQRRADIYRRVNVDGTRMVLEACQEFGVDHFTFASSGGAVYGEPDWLPIDEGHPLQPISPYGVSKRKAEGLVEQMANRGNFKALIYRYGNVYGPGQSPAGNNGVIPIFAASLLRGSQPVIYGDGSQTRDYVFVEDIVKANLMALERGLEGIYNLGTGIGVTLTEIYQQVSAGLGIQMEPQYAPANGFEVQRNALDSRNVARELGWRARTSLDLGLAMTLEAIKQGLTSGSLSSPVGENK